MSVSDPVTPISVLQKQLRLEARAGIEPAHRAFAEPGLTTWLPRQKNPRGHVARIDPVAQVWKSVCP